MLERINELKQEWRNKIAVNRLKAEEENRKRAQIAQAEWDSLIAVMVETFPALDGFIEPGTPCEMNSRTLVANVHVNIPGHLLISIPAERYSGNWKVDSRGRGPFRLMHREEVYDSTDNLGQALCLAEEYAAKEFPDEVEQP